MRTSRRTLDEHKAFVRALIARTTTADGRTASLTFIGLTDLDVSALRDLEADILVMQRVGYQEAARELSIDRSRLKRPA